MSVNRRIAQGTYEARHSALIVVLTCPLRFELVRNTEVNEVYLRCLALEADGGISWLEVLMNEAVAMQVLEKPKHLFANHERCLYGEVAAAEFEEVLQGRSQWLNAHKLARIIVS